MNEVMEFYIDLCKKMYILPHIDQEKQEKYINTSFNFSKDFLDKFAENIAMMLVGIIPGINLMVPFMMVDICKDEYKAEIDSIVNLLRYQCGENKRRTNQYLKRLYGEFSKNI